MSKEGICRAVGFSKSQFGLALPLVLKVQDSGVVAYFKTITNKGKPFVFGFFAFFFPGQTLVMGLKGSAEEWRLGPLG